MGAECVCDEEFFTAANMGFTLSGSGNTIGLTLTGYLGLDINCDSVDIDWGDGSTDSGSAIASYQHAYASGGSYFVCVLVTRDTGFKLCPVEICQDVLLPWVAQECDVFDTAPIDLNKSFDPVPFPNGVIDRAQVKWYKASPLVPYTAADDAAIDIEFWPVRDLSTNTPIIDGDTSLIPMRTKPGQDFFKWPIKFDRPDVDPNIRYQWRVRAHCQRNDLRISPWSVLKIFNTPDFDPATGIFTPPAGLEDLSMNKMLADEEMDIQLYPNPNDGTFWIRFEIQDKSSDVQLTLRDIQGKLIEQQVHSLVKGRQEIIWESQVNLEMGIYMMEIITDRNRYTKRVIIDR